MVTDARLPLGSFCEPLKIRSAPSLPRMDFMDCSPKTKRIASTTFDFPEPFGPTTQTIPCENSKTVFLENDLNPFNSKLLSRIFIPANFSLLMPFRPLFVPLLVSTYLSLPRFEWNRRKYQQ